MKPTFRSLNKILTLCGCERRLFLLGLFVGWGFFANLGSFPAGLVMFSLFAFLGWLKAKDAIKLRLLFNPGSAKPIYEAFQKKPFTLIIYDDRSID